MKLRNVSLLSLAALVLSACTGAPPEAPPDPPVEAAPPALPTGSGATESWWQQVQAAMVTGAYQLQQGESGDLSFANRAHNLRARFGAAGAVTLGPRAEQDGPLNETLGGWSVTLQTVAWGRRGAARPLGPAEPRRGDCAAPERQDEQGRCLRTAQLDRGELLEWWTNDERGLQQGWTLQEPPPGQGEVLLDLEIRGATWALDEQGATLLAGATRLTYGAPVAWDTDGRALEASLQEWRGCPSPWPILRDSSPP